jgi:hypothetical protein
MGIAGFFLSSLMRIEEQPAEAAQGETAPMPTASGSK